MAEIGRDLWRLSITVLLLKQGRLKQVAQDIIQSGFEDF